MNLITQSEFSKRVGVHRDVIQTLEALGVIEASAYTGRETLFAVEKVTELSERLKKGREEVKARKEEKRTKVARVFTVASV